MKKLQQHKSVQLFYRYFIHSNLSAALLRVLLVAVLLTYFAASSYSQKITGVWKGTFESGSNGTNKYPINLNVLLNADSTYTIYSYSWAVKTDGSDTVCVCSVDYKFLCKDSLYLEEQRMILPQNPVYNCLQKMYLMLKVRKNILELKGTWKTTDSNCEDSGYISFYKKREE
jgi:hypothetical protein